MKDLLARAALTIALVFGGVFVGTRLAVAYPVAPWSSPPGPTCYTLDAAEYAAIRTSDMRDFTFVGGEPMLCGTWLADSEARFGHDPESARCYRMIERHGDEACGPYESTWHRYVMANPGPK